MYNQEELTRGVTWDGPRPVNEQTKNASERVKTPEPVESIEAAALPGMTPILNARTARAYLSASLPWIAGGQRRPLLLEPRLYRDCLLQN